MSDAIYALYKECHAPTAVDHVADLSFTAPETRNLIVAKASHLLIYTIVEEDSISEVVPHDADSLLQTDKLPTDSFHAAASNEYGSVVGNEDENLPFPNIKPTTRTIMKMARLELVAQYRLHGVIAAMGVIRTNAPNMLKGQDSLLLTFHDAKMSLLEWSTSTDTIVTVSIHYYENEDYKREFLANPSTSDIRVDPQHRCAVMHFYGDKLAILPFRQDEGIQLGDDDTGSKHPYLPSFVISADELLKGMRNIIDLVFLIGFFEPTVAVLFEPIPTCTGLLPTRTDSCCLAFISLDITQKFYTVISRVDDMPYDCLRLIPVPKPINGVLVVTSNSIFHASQSSSVKGISVNGHATKTTSFPYLTNEHAERGLKLEGVQTVWLKPDRLLMSLRDGALYVLELETDGREVSRFGLVKVGESVLASCACSVGDGYFFLGSKLGDSLLMKFNERKLNDATHYLPIQAGNDLDQSLYGHDLSGPALPPLATASEGSDNAQFAFTVCDSLLNIGPIADFAMGEPIDESGEFRDAEGLKDYEIVTCSGSGKNGAISVLQRNVRPNVLSSFHLAGCLDTWAVRCTRQGQISVGDGLEVNADTFDTFLIISRENGTMVLSSDDELQELESSGFYVDGPTIGLEALFNGTRIVQVYPTGIRLLNSDGELTQIVPTTSDSTDKIVAADIADPYVLAQYSSGDLLLLRSDPETKEMVVCQQPDNTDSSPVVASSLFCDNSGLFVGVAAVQQARKRQSSLQNSRSRRSSSVSANQHPFANIPSSLEKVFESDVDLDMDLYGDKDGNAMEVDQSQTANPSKAPEEGGAAVVEQSREDISTDLDINEENVSGGGLAATKSTWFCLLCREDGAIGLYALPSLEEVFAFPHFDLFPGILADTPSQLANNSSVGGIGIREMSLVNLGKTKQDTYLFAITSLGDLIVYKAFRCVPPVSTGVDTPAIPSTPLSAGPRFPYFSAAHASENRLAVRFTRVRHDILLREPLPPTTPQGDTESADGKKIEELSCNRRLKHFSDVAGYSGVFVNGRKPVWIVLGPRRYLRMHPMNVDGPVKCFSAFHNVNCPKGFIYVNHKDQLRICELPPHVSYDLDWPVRKIPLKRSTHFIANHLPSQTYTLMTSKPALFVLKEGEINSAMEQHKAGTFLPEIPRFTMELLSPVTWEIVDRHVFAESEHVLCLKACSLETKQTASGRKTFIAVGTAFDYGEDLSVKGGIYIFDVIEVVPEPDNPQTNHKFKLICSEDVKGPVSALCAVNGCLLTCIGSKVIIRSFEDNESLTGIAFIDVQVYGNAVCALNNMILLGDMYKSVWFLGYQEEPSKLALLGKDWHPLDIMTGEFLVDGNVLYFIVSDADKNVHLFSYSPYNVQSFGGQKLIRRGDFHVGSRITRMIRLRQRPRKSEYRSMSGSGAFEQHERHMVLTASLDGSMSIVTPVDEKTYRRFHLLHSAMVNGLQHPAGLNPKAFRLMHSNERLASNATKGVLDGDLLSLFPSLAVNRQKEMTKQIGSSVERVLDDLVTVSSSVQFW